MFSRPSSPLISSKQSIVRTTATDHLLRRAIVIALVIVSLLTSAYTALSFYIATQLIYQPPMPIYSTPASLGLQFHYVTFPSREDHIQLRGWFIPGILANGRLTAQRTIIMVHGTHTNRANKASGLLDLSGAFARNGLAVLAFDMRGMGESPPAPLSLGYFEQRDVLGAVDFLRSGPIPYPDLGRPRIIGGWGISMGAATLILAASREQAIRAIVSDCAYADIIPILEREVPKGGHLPALFTPGALRAAQAIYGMNFYAVRPVDVVADIAPRPILFIHGDADDYVPTSNMFVLANAAHATAGANVQTWLVHGAKHAQSFVNNKDEYIARVVAFYNAELGAERGTT